MENWVTFTKDPGCEQGFSMVCFQYHIVFHGCKSATLSIHNVLRKQNDTAHDLMAGKAQHFDPYLLNCNFQFQCLVIVCF